MIVVDASVLANVIGDDDGAGQFARARLAAASAASAPDLVDVETVSVLRRRWLAGDALAEALECSLITSDARHANAPMATCAIEVLEL